MRRVSRKPSLLPAAAAGRLPRRFEDVAEAAVVPGFVASVTHDAVFVRFLAGLTGGHLERCSGYVGACRSAYPASLHPTKRRHRLESLPELFRTPASSRLWSYRHPAVQRRVVPCRTTPRSRRPGAAVGRVCERPTGHVRRGPVGALRGGRRGRGQAALHAGAQAQRHRLHGRLLPARLLHVRCLAGRALTRVFVRLLSERAVNTVRLAFCTQLRREAFSAEPFATGPSLLSAVADKGQRLRHVHAGSLQGTSVVVLRTLNELLHPYPRPAQGDGGAAGAAC